MDKLDSAYKTIGEVAEILKLKSNKNGILPTHTIRMPQFRAALKTSRRC